MDEIDRNAKIELAAEAHAGAVRVGGYDLFDYSSYPGEEPPHVVRDRYGKAVFRSDDQAAAETEFERLTRRHEFGAVVDALDASQDLKAKAAQNQTLRDIWDAEVRAEQMIWLGALGGEPSDTLTAFCEDTFDGTPLHKSFDALPRLKILGRDASDTPEDIAAAMIHMFSDDRNAGLIVQAATPMFRYFGPDFTGAQFGWGNVYLEWIYAASIENLGPALIAWANGMHEKDRAKAQEKAKGKMA
mgnify:FL=1